MKKYAAYMMQATAQLMSAEKLEANQLQDKEWLKSYLATLGKIYHDCEEAEGMDEWQKRLALQFISDTATDVCKLFKED